MEHYRTILIIGIIEILIGSVTIFSNFLTLALSINNKTPNVLIFVITAGITSTLIGVGLLKLKRTAYQLLVYFSTVVLLSKALIFMGIIQLNGSLETTVPTPIKRTTSFVYHTFVLYFLNKRDVKQIFHS